MPIETAIGIDGRTPGLRG